MGNIVAFMAELLVDDYGYLFGGEEVFPVDVTKHDWLTPYPQFKKMVSLSGGLETLGVAPTFFGIPRSVTGFVMTLHCPCFLVLPRLM